MQPNDMMNATESYSHSGTSIFSADEISRFRSETAGTKQVIHLNNAGAALIPDVVKAAQLEHIELESRIGGYEAAALKAETIRAFYEQCALLFNTKARNIAFTSSATDSFTRALSSIPFEKGDVILTDRDDFVSNQIQFLSLTKKLGVSVVHINNSAIGGVDLDDLRTKLYDLRPRLLAITHIPTNSGLIQPVDEIAKIYGDYIQSHPAGTWYILDACQSVGQMKLDVQKLKCDFLSVTCRKFLRGPRGTGALYISDKALDAGLEPLFIDMRGARWLQSDSYAPVSDAKRFEDWEFAYASVVATKVAIEYCLAIGEERIQQRVRLLADMTRQRLSAITRIRVLDRGPELGGLVTFHVKGSDPVTLTDQLRERRINVVPSYRAYGLLDFDEKGVDWAIRASPHYYNTEGEIDALIYALAEISDK